MAQSKNNPLTHGASGMVGGVLVYRTWNGKTFMSAAPKKPTKESLLQKENRTKFKRATEFAKSMMKDPLKKAEYKEVAKRLNLTNAYTAAITEYMRKPEINDVAFTESAGNSREEVKVIAGKKGFDIQEVEVAILNINWQLVEVGNAVKGRNNEWIYRISLNTDEKDLLQFRIKVKDRTNNTVMKIFEKARN